MFSKTVQAQRHRLNTRNGQVPYDKAKSYFYSDGFPFASSINGNEAINDREIIHRNNKTGKSVSFSNLEIRFHSIVIGDHPCCELPLSLGWSYTPQITVVPVDTYENGRGPRKDRSSLRMTYFERKNTLKRISGWTEKDIIREERRFKSTTDLNSLRNL